MLTVTFCAIIFLVILGFAVTVSHYEGRLDIMEAKIKEYSDIVHVMNRENVFLRNELEKGSGV